MSTQIFVSGLPKSIKESDIRDAFKEYGNIKVIYIPEKLINGQTTCFVSFSTHEEAKEAKHHLNYSNIKLYNENTTIKITYGDEKSLSIVKEGKNKIIVSNLTSEVTEGQIYDLFSNFGEVLYCSMPLAITGKAIGVCFIVYETKEEADTAIENLDGSSLDDKVLSVRYAPKL